MAVVDTFTNTDGTLLHNHTRDDGGAWNKFSGLDAIINSDRVKAITSEGSGFSRYMIDEAAPSNTQFVELEHRWDGAEGFAGPLARVDPVGGDTWYEIIYSQFSNVWLLRKNVSGYTTIDTFAASVPPVGTITTIRLEVEDGVQRGYIDGVHRLTGSDTEITEGKPGLLMSAGSSGDERPSIDAYKVNFPVELSAAPVGEGEATATLEIGAKPVSDAIDDFEDGVIDTDLWETVTVSPGTVLEQNGRIELETGGSGGHAELISKAEYNLTDDEIFVELSNLAAVALADPREGDQFFELYLDDDNHLRFWIHTGLVLCHYSSGGAGTTLSNPGYDPVAHRWLQFRHSGGTVFWEASPDGHDWSELASVATPIDISALKIRMYALEI